MAAFGTVMAATSMTMVTSTFRFLFVQDGHHDHRVLSWAADLEEWVRMVHALFACATVVEILADAALVADARYGISITSIACDVRVLDIISFGSRLVCIDHLVATGSFLADQRVLLGHEADEGFFGCSLKLALDQILQSFPWDALVSLLLVSLFLGGDNKLWFLLDHLDVLDLLLDGRVYEIRLVYDKLNAFVVTESAGVRHLEVGIVFDNYRFSIMVNVADCHRFLHALCLGKAAYLT